MNTELHQFGIDDDGGPPDPRWKKNVNRFLRALYINPHLKIGTNNSEIVFPESGISKPARAAASVSYAGAFCDLYQEGEDWFVSGGPVRVCDTKTIQVPPWEVDVTGSPADRLLYVEVNVEVNRTDDGDYFMSGIKTSSDITLDMQDDTSITSYPTGTAPVIGTGLGVIILAVGLLKVVDGIPKFYPAGCGAFILEHCNGNLTHRAR